MKKLIYLILAGTLAFASCSKDDPAPIAVGGVTLDKTQLTLKPQQSETLTATITPEDAADKAVTWSSSDTQVATVDDSGKVMAVAVGSTTITARAGEKSVTCAVTVAWPVETVLIKAGKFTMGSPENEADRQANETQHEVTLTKDFYMGKYEVTNAQYAAFLNNTGVGSDGNGSLTGSDNKLKFIYDHASWGVVWNNDSWFPAAGKSDYPVISATWYGAMAYAEWAGGTLPTEAQWEYACRAGTTTTYFFGNDPDALGDYAWYNGNAEGMTHEVGTKKPNAWGLYDMYGNVYERCLDSWDKSDYRPDPITDPISPNSGSDKTARGGCWNDPESKCRTAARFSNSVTGYRTYTGFRVIFPVE